MHRNRTFLFFFAVTALLSIFLFCSSCQKETPAELALINGRIITLDSRFPEVRGLAVRNGRIIAAGAESHIRDFINDKTQIIDLKGGVAIPGLTDSHGHFMSMGESLINLDLASVQNWDDVIALVAEAVKTSKPGDWILGRGWHQEKWNKVPEPNVEGIPSHQSLSAVSPDNPVILRHASGHALFANARAMTLAAVNENTPPPSGGEILKDKNGQLTGLFRENAENLISSAYNSWLNSLSPEQSRQRKINILKRAVDECLKNGVTSFHDAGVSFEVVDFYKEMIDQGQIPIRLNVMLSESNENLKKHIKQYKLTAYGDNRLTVRTIKRLIDGALGAHGAWLLEPYDSLPSSTGLNTETPEYMKETAQIALDNGFQLSTHCIGDRGNRECLNIYETAFKTQPELKNLRWRIEHAQHLHPSDVPRFAKLGVIAAMQGVHCTSDGPWVPKRLGEKRCAETSYVWRNLMDSGAIICNGTDVPVEKLDPISSLYASISRKMKNGLVFHGEQRMSREEALRSYSLNGAYASFEENIKGSLSVGKLADITVLSKDLLSIPEDEIPQIKILYTIIGGQVLYTAPQ